MVSFSTTGLLLPVALFPPGTTHDCAIGQAGPSIWSRLPPAILHGGPHAADRARGRSRSRPLCFAGRGRSAADEETRTYRISLARGWVIACSPCLQGGAAR